jgi:predicted nucleotidyltransferase
LDRFASPAALIEQRLAIAREVADAAAGTEAVTAALVVGSTALGRCSASADLDLVVLTPGESDRPAFESRTIGGVRVEIERVEEGAALAATEGEGWIWELRQAARLATAVAVHDPRGFAARLALRAASMRPDRDRYETTLREIYVSIAELGQTPASAAARGEIIRGCLDNLVVLALLDRPRRYQKAKWALADLIHAGETELADAVLRAYGATEDRDSAARETARTARELVEAALAHSGAPPHAVLLAMGYAPQFAEASYVSRCLADAEDLASGGRALEAQYVARFAARLAASLVASGAVQASIVDTFEQASAELAALYAANFAAVPEPAPTAIDAVLDSADACVARFAAASLVCEPAR